MEEIHRNGGSGVGERQIVQRLDNIEKNVQLLFRLYNKVSKARNDEHFSSGLNANRDVIKSVSTRDDFVNLHKYNVNIECDGRTTIYEELGEKYCVLCNTTCVVDPIYH